MDQALDKWSDSQKTRWTDKADFVQYLFLIGSFVGIVFSFYNYTWSLLAACTGSSVGLLWRDVEWHRAGCLSPQEDAAYLSSQAAAMLIGPYVAWSIMISSKALDRVYGPAVPDHCQWAKRTWEQWEHPSNLAQGLLRMCRCLLGCQRLQCFELELESDNGEYLDLHFFQTWQSWSDDGENENDPDDLSHGEVQDEQGLSSVDESHAPGRPIEIIEGLESGSKCQAALIYSKHGDHVKPQEIETGRATMKVGQKEYSNIKEAEPSHHSNPILLLVYTKDERKRFLLHADSWNACLSCVQTAISRFLLPFLVLLLALGWQYSFHKHGGYKEASILVLMLPEVIEKLLHQAAADTVTNATGFQTEAGYVVTEVDDVLLKGWNCTRGAPGSSLGAHIAVWDTSFFYAACFLFVWLGCYHLHVAAGSLRELTALLHLHAHEDDHAQAVVLHLGSVQRFLQILGACLLSWVVVMGSGS